LASLRGGTTPRPRFDPALAGGLRAWLEDAAFEVGRVLGDDAAPLYLGPRVLLGETAPASPPDVADPVGPARDGTAPSDEVLVSRLVHALFCQLITVGAIGDPLSDALDALRADGGAGWLVRHVESSPGAARAALARSVSAHASHLRHLVPRLAPGWMPRTDDRVAVALGGGAVVLHGVFDLLVGVPESGVASLCGFGLSTAAAPGTERRRLHYLALLETLRSGTPPYRLAVLSSATGRYAVEDVRVEHLRAMAVHLVARLGELGRD
jgi:hypothetical protein